jgi:arylsulfatase A
MGCYHGKMDLRSFFVIWLLATIASGEERKPNIVLIMADDVGIEGFGCYGGTSYKTPNIDKLAEDGLRFTHAYAQPLCTPTRVQLMTGRYNHRNWKVFGILDPKERTFGHLLGGSGGVWEAVINRPPRPQYCR